ncbi:MULTISPECIES: response regulator transcription factor [unclassified Spirosoma]|uniref:response regulator n=1 Tax=unclassified Spirosoma TaxID=2621999 RepID=UPI00095F680F|nr:MULTISPECIES: response regulator transcription factor [unclassified Spirosoma]MBN8825201.1 response regulator transcription factor [Spirosoma sp.]OJW75307.1 MAG: LuxR family transcriptional regulator [Spirosoma sp. 48-14]
MRILLAEDHRILLDSLALLLSSIEGIEVVSKHTNGKQVLTSLEIESNIDLVVSDLQMPVMGGIELTLQLRERFPHVRICLLTVADQPEAIKEAVRAGADGYVLKSAERSELEMALTMIEKGHKFYSQQVLMQLANETGLELAPVVDKPQKIAITQRELDVLKLIAQEYSGTQIAEKLFISPTTVETHRKHLMQKLGVQTTIGLVKYALKYQLV